MSYQQHVLLSEYSKCCAPVYNGERACSRCKRGCCSCACPTLLTARNLFLLGYTYWWVAIFFSWIPCIAARYRSFIFEQLRTPSQGGIVNCLLHTFCKSCAVAQESRSVIIHCNTGRQHLASVETVLLTATPPAAPRRHHGFQIDPSGKYGGAGNSPTRPNVYGIDHPAQMQDDVESFLNTSPTSTPSQLQNQHQHQSYYNNLRPKSFVSHKSSLINNNQPNTYYGSADINTPRSSHTTIDIITTDPLPVLRYGPPSPQQPQQPQQQQPQQQQPQQPQQQQPQQQPQQPQQPQQQQQQQPQQQLQQQQSLYQDLYTAGSPPHTPQTPSQRHLLPTATPTPLQQAEIGPSMVSPSPSQQSYNQYHSAMGLNQDQIAIGPPAQSDPQQRLRLQQQEVIGINPMTEVSMGPGSVGSLKIRHSPFLTKNMYSRDILRIQDQRLREHLDQQLEQEQPDHLGYQLEPEELEQEQFEECEISPSESPPDQLSPLPSSILQPKASQEQQSSLRQLHHGPEKSPLAQGISIPEPPFQHRLSQPKSPYNSEDDEKNCINPATGSDLLYSTERHLRSGRGTTSVRSNSTQSSKISSPKSKEEKSKEETPHQSTRMFGIQTQLPETGIIHDSDGIPLRMLPPDTPPIVFVDSEYEEPFNFVHDTSPITSSSPPSGQQEDEDEAVATATHPIPDTYSQSPSQNPISSSPPQPPPLNTATASTAPYGIRFQSNNNRVGPTSDPDSNQITTLRQLQPLYGQDFGPDPQFNPADDLLAHTKYHNNHINNPYYSKAVDFQNNVTQHQSIDPEVVQRVVEIKNLEFDHDFDNEQELMYHVLGGHRNNNYTNNNNGEDGRDNTNDFGQRHENPDFTPFRDYGSMYYLDQTKPEPGSPGVPTDTPKLSRMHQRVLQPAEPRVHRSGLTPLSQQQQLQAVSPPGRATPISAPTATRALSLHQSPQFDIDLRPRRQLGTPSHQAGVWDSPSAGSLSVTQTPQVHNYHQQHTDQDGLNTFDDGFGGLYTPQQTYIRLPKFASPTPISLLDPARPQISAPKLLASPQHEYSSPMVNIDNDDTFLHFVASSPPLDPAESKSVLLESIQEATHEPGEGDILSLGSNLTNFEPNSPPSQPSMLRNSGITNTIPVGNVAIPNGATNINNASTSRLQSATPPRTKPTPDKTV